MLEVIGNPKTVCLVGLGSSAAEYMQHMVGSELKFTHDQVWTVNMGLRIFRHDILWVMDDLRQIADRYPAYAKLLQRHDRPIITSAAYPEFPQSVAFPIKEVAEKVGDDLFTNTVCYVIAYAMVAGVKDITLYGCDFFYPKIDVREEGGANASYLLGLARHFGMKFHIPQSSTLLSAYLGQEVNGELHRPLYGYAKQPLFATGGLKRLIRPAVVGEETDGNEIRSEERPELREDQGNDAGKAQVDQSRTASQFGSGQPADLHPARKSVERRRSGVGRRKSSRLVLDGKGKSAAIGPDGVRLGQNPADQTVSPSRMETEKAY